MDLGGEIVKVCSISDLIEMKKSAARPKDIEDIKHLNELLQMKKDEENEI